jgi:hypothetical protein
MVDSRKNCSQELSSLGILIPAHVIDDQSSQHGVGLGRRLAGITLEILLLRPPSYPSSIYTDAMW